MNSYVETYNNVIRDAKNLPPEIVENITVPEAIYAPPEYLASPIRVLFAGAEAYGGGQSLSDAEINKTANDRLNWKECFFQKRVVGKKYSTPFWRQFDWIAEGLGLIGREAIAYSNVCRVQRIEEVNGSYSLSAGKPLYADNFGTTRLEVGRWQSPLVELEWVTLKPDVVVVSAIDGHQWLSKTFPDLVRRDVSIGNFRVQIWDNLPVPTIGIRHPGKGRWQASDEIQPKVIQLIERLIETS
ncbi:hypothetical protein DSM14862_00277 [Sulfitobacter indolifex]|uniref:Uracil-DNA glycosylase-like domain-containing protein n=1 Tax=Sulfitobacter indolifex HEL-45 TaxID=391624 RepID=A0ABM9XAI0_9RHOB|nr:hypothetical protein [Sulfitobacter indolifex]EDQ06536.1 hypothetical protein OIHEL45_06960 [Sulfitobacter indolifex HEL-45]UOA17527.1 hypothetical protein DSM14862_00277 [Sulfitobacter indolifex]